MKEFEKDMEGFMPVNAQTGKEIELAMQDIFLSGKLLAVGGRLFVQHTFKSGEKKPLEVIYTFVLPRDAALRRFRITGAGFDIKSKLKPLKEAKKDYEKGISEGHLSTLAQQYRDGYVSLNVGNIRPGEIVTVSLEIVAGTDLLDDGMRFRFPFTMAPVYHRGMRVTTVDKGTGEMELPEDEFGDLILPPFKASADGLHSIGFDIEVVMPEEISKISSPSHTLEIENSGAGKMRIKLSTAKDVPNRDLVLDVKMKAPFSGVLSGINKKDRGQFIAVIASKHFGETPTTARNVVFLLDRSGSMQGVTIEQARKALLACIGALSANDKVGFVAFDDHTDVFHKGLQKADDDTRDKLRKFIEGIDARGGTELFAGIRAAHALIGKDGGDIFLITDGQVGATENIIQGTKALGIRVHCLGIGAASQDRFLTMLARDTGGVSRFVSPAERVDMAALELFASAGKPAAADIAVKVEGMKNASIAPEPQKTVFAGHPLVVFGEGDAGEGRIVVEWLRDAEKCVKEVPIAVKQGGEATTLRLIRGARLITDLESQLFPETAGRAEKKQLGRIEKALKALGEEYGLANRQMALVAVVERAGDQAGALPKTTVVPVGMPQYMEFGAYFERSAHIACCETAPMMSAKLHKLQMPPMKSMAKGMSIMQSKISDRSAEESRQKAIKFAEEQAAEERAKEASMRSDKHDLAVHVAGRLRSDGGMPGDNDDDRICKSIAALFILVEAEKESFGTFYPQIKRLIDFLENFRKDAISDDKKEIVQKAIEMAKTRVDIHKELLKSAEQIALGREEWHGRPAHDARAGSPLHKSSWEKIKEIVSI